MKRWVLLLLPVLFLAACGSEQSTQDNSATQQTQPEVTGKVIFANNCIQCHSLHADKMGPKLEGVMAHWDNDTTRIRAFIRNSKDAVQNGDPRAVAVYKQWGERMMTPMPHLSDKDVDMLIDYINKGVD